MVQHENNNNNESPRTKYASHAPRSSSNICQRFSVGVCVRRVYIYCASWSFLFVVKRYILNFIVISDPHAADTSDSSMSSKALSSSSVNGGSSNGGNGSNNNLLILGGIVGNVLSVVGVVICNKYITEVDGYDFMVFLSFLHFSFTMVGTRVMLSLGFFQDKSAPLSGVLPVAMGSLLSVAFMNLNLSHNSVGFYQLSKLACIPFTLFVQYIAYHQSVPRSVQLTLIPITVGVGYATVYDLDLNLVGTIFAACAVVATALSQIFTNTYQKSLDCNAMQLLFHTSPYIALGMIILCPFFDDMPRLANFVYTPSCLARIFVSCLFALGVNISNYLVLGMTSPLTYQVLGHLKTVLIIVLGFLMFNKKADTRNIIGIGIAMVGVIAYTEVRRKQSSTPTLPVSSQSGRP